MGESTDGKSKVEDDEGDGGIEIMSLTGTGYTSRISTNGARKRTRVPRQKVFLQSRQDRHTSTFIRLCSRRCRSIFKRRWIRNVLASIPLFILAFCYTRYSLMSFDPTKSVQWHITRDYASIDTPNDLQSILSDYNERKLRCLRGSLDKDCKCMNPLAPQDRGGYRHWDTTHHRNKEFAEDASPDLDVVFLGDSITEQWMGTRMSYDLPKRQPIYQVFQELFGEDFTALPLGISGDTSTNLLYRIQNGEVPSTLNPPVFWILIGANDFIKLWCTPEMVDRKSVV